MDPQQIEKMLISRQLPETLPPDEGWVLPHYDGLSIANIPATVAALLDSDLPGALPTLPQELWAEWTPKLSRVVLIVLDALGLRMLQNRWAGGQGQPFHDLTQTGRLIPLTSVFPSTTDAALVSMSTGFPPATHGWLAYTMYLREFGLAANAILLCPVWTRKTDQLLAWGMDPETVLPVPSLAQRLTSEGVRTAGLYHSGFHGTGFSTMLYRGVKQHRRHILASDLWVHLRHMLAETNGSRAFITAYWSGLDTLAHAYGPDSDLWKAEFDAVSHLLSQQFLGALSAQDREGTLLLITADHGQIHIPPEQVLIADQDPELSQHLMVPVTGESRAAFVYHRLGRAEAVRDYLVNAFPGWFVVRESAKLLELGLMGKPIADETYARAGELIVLPRGARALQAAQSPFSSVGRHGGLSEEEMLVPLIGVRLEAMA